MSALYIVDIDGTLADLSDRLRFIQNEHKDWDAFFDNCDEDKPIWDVIHVIQSLGRDARIIYVTGRPERVRIKTFCWLNRYNLPPGQLIMRKDGDHRPDTEAKKELVESLLAQGERISGVFSKTDRQCAAYGGQWGSRFFR